MNNLLLSPLFTRYLFAIFGTVLVVIILFSFFWLNEREAVSLKLFVNDTNTQARILNNILVEDPSLFPTYLNVINTYSNTGQLIDVVDKSELKARLEHSEIIATEYGVDIFFNEQEDIFYVNYPVEGGQYLLIADLPDGHDRLSTIPPFQERLLVEANESDTFWLMVILAVVMIFFLIAILLIIMVRAIYKHIQYLDKMNQAFSNGNLQTRIDVAMPEPLNSLAISFNHMASAIENLVTEKDVIAGAISHELRTPLARLQLASGLALKHCHDEKVKPFIHDIEHYIDELDVLTQQILMLSKLDHQREKALSMSHIDIVRLVKDRMQHFELATDDKKIYISHVDGLVVHGDVFFLHIVVDNIIKNALNYCSQLVEISLSQQHENCIVMLFEDDGEGIPEAQWASVLLPFARVQISRDRQSGGHGLGLAIASMIMKLHGGKITVSDSSLGGAKITVILPAA